MAQSQLDLAISGLVRDLNLKFQPPEFIPGCVVKDVTDINEYATENGWIECLCGRHNQQRVRYKGFPAGVEVDDELDVVYYPSHKFFEVHGVGGATATSADQTKVTKIYESDLGGVALSAAANGDLTAVGSVYIPSDLAHVGDLDTRLLFSGNQIELDVGGVTMLRLTNTTQNNVAFGDTSGVDDVDISINDGQVFIEGSSGEVTVTANVSANAHGFIVKNTSGAAASAGDVGYLDDSNEYQTTTTAEDERANPVAVLIGGDNNADIYVTRGPGRATLNYVGSAPSTGDILTFSTTAGSVQARSTMHPGVLAEARANGSGGTVEAELLLRRETNTLASTTNALFISGTDGSDFVATISATGVSGDKVYYNAPSSGNVNTLTPSASTELIKVILHNTTQTEEAKVIATGSDGGGNFIQVSDSADISGWVSTDAITARSQTNTSLFTGTTYFYDLEVTSAEVPELATALLFTVRFWDTGSTGNPLGVHPYESNSNPKRKQTNSVGASGGASPDAERSMPLIQRRFCIAWDVSGSGTGSFRLRLDGARVAV